MGPSASERCQGRFATVLCAGHGGLHQAQVSVSPVELSYALQRNSVLYSQPGQTSIGEVARKDLRAELLAAEEEARNRKRKADGKPPLLVTEGPVNGAEDEEVNKRRKLLQEALELDKDDDEEDGEEDNPGSSASKSATGVADEGRFVLCPLQ